MRSEDMESRPAGFVKVQKMMAASAQRSGSYRFEILLPERVAEQIDEEEKIRQEKVAAALRDEKPEEVA